jgi:hypothetical protein
MLKEVKGGRNIYGEIIGIIMTERIFPRIPGEMGNASTFDFPVRLHVVRGIDISTQWKMIAGEKQFLEPFLQATKHLEQEGVRAITSNCGFLVLFQDLLADAVNIPVFMSSLLQIPLVFRMLRKDQIIGVITGDNSPRGLTKGHFEAAGAGDIPVVAIGMEDSEAFDAIKSDKEILYPQQLQNDIVDRAKKLVSENPNMGAVILECANLPPYAKAIQDAVNLPVFDFITLTNWVYSAVVRHEFTGYM